MSVFYDVCKVFNVVNHFHEFPINSGCQDSPTCARFPMVSRHFMVFWERPDVSFYDVCRVFNDFETFYGILEVSESQLL